MLTDEWYPTLDAPKCRARSPIRSQGLAPTGVRMARTAASAEADVIILATGFESHAFVAPMEVDRRRRAHPRQEWDPAARAYLGLSRAGLPEHVPDLRAQHQRGHRLGHLRHRGGSDPCDRRDERDEADGLRQIEVSRGVEEAFNRELRSTLAGTVWHTGCESWYLDENGNDPNQWPWAWRRLPQRATAQIEPGHYQLGPVSREPLARR